MVYECLHRDCVSCSPYGICTCCERDTLECGEYREREEELNNEDNSDCERCSY